MSRRLPGFFMYFLSILILMTLIPVPLRFVSENSGFPVDFSSNASTATITIGSGGPVGDDGGPTANPEVDEEIEPYVVKGRVALSSGA